MKTAFVGFRCDDDFLRRLDVEAKSWKLSRTDFIIHVLQREIAQKKTEMMLVREAAPEYGTKPDGEHDRKS